MQVIDSFDVVTHNGSLGISPSGDDDRFISLTTLSLLEGRVDSELYDKLTQ